MPEAYLTTAEARDYLRLGEDAFAALLRKAGIKQYARGRYSKEHIDDQIRKYLNEKTASEEGSGPKRKAGEFIRLQSGGVK